MSTWTREQELEARLRDILAICDGYDQGRFMAARRAFEQIRAEVEGALRWQEAEPYAVSGDTYAIPQGDDRVQML